MGIAFLPALGISCLQTLVLGIEAGLAVRIVLEAGHIPLWKTLAWVGVWALWPAVLWVVGSESVAWVMSRRRFDEPDAQPHAG